MPQRKSLDHLKSRIEPDLDSVVESPEAKEFLQEQPGILDNTPTKIKYTHVTYSVPLQLREDIKTIAKSLDIPQSTIVTKALELVVEQYNHLL